MRRRWTILGWLCLMFPGPLVAQGIITTSPDSVGTLTAELPGGVTMEFVWIEPGAFLMGSPESEPERAADEGPQHEVTISQGFYLGKFEVTQGQWEAVMGTRPWAGQNHVKNGPNHPAVNIDWADWQEFIRRLNEVEGAKVYRLPTEAEWEYACRAGTTTRWSFGDDENQLGDYAWYRTNAWDVGEQYAHAVGTKLPNPWGVYDMHGNVQEWVQDWYASDYYSNSPSVDPQGSATGFGHFIRGGDFGLNDHVSQHLRSAFRSACTPCGGAVDVGARLLKQLSDKVITPAGTTHEMVSLRWRFPTGGEVQSSPAIQADGTVVYMEHWPGRPSSSPAIGSDGTTYVGSWDGHLYAIDREGRERWRFKTNGGIQSSPAIGSDGTIYIGSWDSYVYAIDQEGRQRWRFKTGWIVSASPAIGPDGIIYVGSEDGYVYAIDREGRQRWRSYLGSPMQSSPVIGAEGTIYIGAPDGHLYAIGTDGKRNWRFRTGSGIGGSPAIGSDGTIYVLSGDEYIYALGMDGRERWRYRTGAQFSSPAIGSDGTVYVGAGGLYALDADGRELWHFSTIQGASSPAIGADGTIYIADESGYAYAIQKDGKEQWRFDTNGRVVSSPAIGDDGTIYVNSDDGHLYAIGNVDGEGTVDQPGPSFNLSNTSLSFASTQVGATSQQTLTISNTGTASLSVTSITVTGADAGQFRVSPTTATIAAGQNQTLTITFAPTSAGSKTASLSIVHNAAGSPSTVSLSGTGQEAGGVITTIAEAPSRGIAVDERGFVYIAGYEANHRVLRVSPEGITTTFAGTGQSGFSGDGGPATQATLSNPHDVAVDALGAIYIVDHANHRVRRVSPEGSITTIAGTGQSGPFSGDGGPATQATLNYPIGITVDPRGNVYVADYNNHRVRRVSPDGPITTFAGTGNPGYSGDGGPATQANLNRPVDVVIDAAGTVYVTEENNHRVRRVSPEGIITTFAGTGEPGYSGDGGPAAQARLDYPAGIAVDTRGNVYIADWNGYRVRRVSPEGIITTFAGTGESGYSGDGGPAAQAKLRPYGLAVDTQGNVYIADDGNRRIRKVTPGGGGTTPPPPSLPAIRLSTTSLSFDNTNVGSTSQKILTVSNTGTQTLSITGFTVMGTDGGQFGVSPTTATIAAGQNQPFTVTFAPTSVGQKSAFLSIAHNAPGIPYTVPLNGRGKLPNVTVSSDTLAFGRVGVGQNSSQVLTINNNTTGAITVNNVVPGDPQYTVSSRTFSLATGSSRDISVTFTPLEGRSPLSTLTILTSDLEVPALTVVLAAESGVSGGPPSIAVFPTTLSFGSVALGQSKSLTLSVTNEGGNNLRVLNIVASSGDVTVSKTGFSLAPGGEELLNVILQPTQLGSFSETLDLPSNDPAHPLLQVPLRATVGTSGGRPSLALDVTQLAFGQVAIGETGEFTLPVRNAGSGSLTLSNAVSDNTQVVVSPTTLTVPPQETRSLTVRFRPLPGRERSGRVTLFSNDTAQPQVGVSWSALDVRSPYLEMTALRPADAAFGVSANTELQLTFSEALFFRRGFTALDAELRPEPLSGPLLDDLQVRGDGRTVVIPVQLARNQVYRLVIYGATGRSGLELFDMVEATFSTGTAPLVLATLSGTVGLEAGQQLNGSVYLFDPAHRLTAQGSVALDGSFELSGVSEGTYSLYLDGSLADGRPASGAYDANGDGLADVLQVRAGVNQTGLQLTPVVRSSTAPTVSSSLVQGDLDSTAGNQRQGSLGNLQAGQEVVLEVYATNAEQWTGSAVTVAFDTTKVYFAGAEEGDNLLKKNGGTALFLSHMDPVASTVEYGGAIMGPTASTAVSGSGLLGRFRFTTLEGFSGQTELQVTRLSLQTLAGKTKVEPNLTVSLSSTTAQESSSGPVSMDFSPASGDQGQRTGGSATPGKQYPVQLHVADAPQIDGWSVTIDYDPTQVRYVSGSFAPSAFIPGLTPLVDERQGQVNVSGAVLVGSGKASGNGLLGTVTFEVLEGFGGRTELVIPQVSLKHVDTGEEILTTHATAAITQETVAGGLAGDFNGDNQVNFSDFFLFADAFGGSDPLYDLSGDGSVNFSDFFLFADAFGGEVRAKLMELAQQYLGLPAGPTLEQNYPNPFNAQTTIAYQLPEAGQVRLEIYDLLGQRMRVLVDQTQGAGYHQVIWDGQDGQGQVMASGVYLYRIEAGPFTAVRRLAVVK